MQWNITIEEDGLKELYDYKVNDVSAQLSFIHPSETELYVVEGAVEQYRQQHPEHKIIYYSKRTTEHERLAREHLRFEKQRLEHIVNREAALMPKPVEGLREQAV